MSWPQAMSRRLARQGLVGAAVTTSPVTVVERMLAAQAQVPSAAELSVALRSASGTVVDVRQAVADRTLVRAAGLRGTIHLVAAADLGVWTGVFSTLPVHRSPVPADERPSSRDIDVLCAAIGDTVAGAPPLTLAELHEGVVSRVGPWAGDPVMPAFQGTWPRWRLAQGIAARRGLLCFGPNRGRVTTYTAPQAFEPVAPDEATAQLLLRYLRAYGPSTAAAYARWHAAPVGWATRTFAELAASGQIIEVDLDGEAAWVAADDLDFPDGPPDGVRLLPYFDALAIAAHPRERFYPGRAYGRALARGQAGNFPVLVVDGEVAGVWHPRRSGRRVRITVEPLAPLPRSREAELEAEADRVGHLQGLVTELTIGEVTVGPHA